MPCLKDSGDSADKGKDRAPMPLCIPFPSRNVHQPLPFVSVGKSIPDSLACSSFLARIGLRLQTASPNFSGFRYIRGQEQLVT
jgi:hypothetical protein